VHQAVHAERRIEVPVGREPTQNALPVGDGAALVGTDVPERHDAAVRQDDEAAPRLLTSACLGHDPAVRSEGTVEGAVGTQAGETGPEDVVVAAHHDPPVLLQGDREREDRRGRWVPRLE
jgi:hypothetical protein